MKKNSFIHFFLLAGGIFSLGFFSMPALAEDAGNVQELLRVIDAQQQQIESQQKQLDEQRQLLKDLQTQVESLVDKEDTKEAKVFAGKHPSETQVGPKSADATKVVTSGQDRVKLSISGMVNRAVNIVDDGKETDAFFVDNDNAESRVNFLAIAKISDDLTLGSRLEVSIAPDKAGNVNQNDKEAGDVFEQRWATVALDSKRYGKLSLGKGFTASYGTASRDLSKTNVISYVTVADTAGGILFRQTSDDTLTNLKIAQAFQSYDGLNRRSRVRYDTPTFNGFQLSTSLLTEQRYDAAVWWGGQGHGFKAIGAASFADPKIDGASHQYAGSFSMLHEETGLNLTLSTGLLERDTQSNGENYYAKLGWIADFFSVGKTAFAIDYNKTEKQPTENDDGYSSGIAAVQHFEKYGTEIFSLYRIYSLDRDVEPDVHDINVFSLGARLKF